MSSLDFTKLRQGNPDCPSDLRLEQLVSGALAEGSDVAVHVSGCASCGPRVAVLRQGWAALPSDPRPMLAAVRRAAAVPLATPWWRRALVPGLLFTAALVAVVMSSAPPVDEVRVKGGLQLRVFRLEKGHSQEVLSGASFAPGDRLRFVVDVPSAGAVSVVGIDHTGALYRAWPPAAEDVKRSAGAAQELPGAVALDDTHGDETLYLVHCPGRETAPVCESAGAGQAPRCEAGCELTAFVVKKP